MGFFKTLFSLTGLLIVIYVLIGIFLNTRSPHIPMEEGLSTASYIHSWVQYFISILFWPLSLWTPTFTVGQWHQPLR